MMMVYVDRFGRLDVRRQRLLRAAHAAMTRGMDRTTVAATFTVTDGNRWGGPQTTRTCYSEEKHARLLATDPDMLRAQELGRRMRDAASVRARLERVHWRRSVELDFAALLRAR